MFKSRIDTEAESLHQMRDVKAAAEFCSLAVSKVESAIYKLGKKKATSSEDHDLGKALHILQETSKVLEAQLKNGVYGPAELYNNL